MATIFTTTLFIATASLALWIDVRAPSLAPSGLKWRALFAIVMLEICGFVPTASGSYVGLYGTIFGVLVPLLVGMWLSALWLLRAAADALASRY